jgi:hypothetical protein
VTGAAAGVEMFVHEPATSSAKTSSAAAAAPASSAPKPPAPSATASADDDVLPPVTPSSACAGPDDDGADQKEQKEQKKEVLKSALAHLERSWARAADAGARRRLSRPSHPPRPFRRTFARALTTNHPSQMEGAGPANDYMVARARRVLATAHSGQTRKGGEGRGRWRAQIGVVPILRGGDGGKPRGAAPVPV